MKAVVRSSIMTILVLIGILSFGASSQAYVSNDQEFMVVHQRGITWEPAEAEVASWGNSYQLATITSRQEAPYLHSLLRGLNGEFWIDGNEEVGNHRQLVKQDFWPNMYRAKGESEDSFKKHSFDRWAMADRDRRHDWSGYDEYNSRHIPGFIVERSPAADPAPTPIPSAALLLGSGLSMIGGLRTFGQNVKFF